MGTLAHLGKHDAADHRDVTLRQLSAHIAAAGFAAALVVLLFPGSKQ